MRDFRLRGALHEDCGGRGTLMLLQPQLRFVSRFSLYRQMWGRGCNRSRGWGRAVRTRLSGQYRAQLRHPERSHAMEFQRGVGNICVAGPQKRY